MSKSHSADETARVFERSLLLQRLVELVHSGERVLVSGSGGVGKSTLLQTAFPVEPILIGNHLTQVMNVSYDQLESGTCFIVDDAHRLTDKQLEQVVECLKRSEKGCVVSIPQARITRAAPVIEYSLSIKLILALQQGRGYVTRIFLDTAGYGKVTGLEQRLNVQRGEVNIISEVTFGSGTLIV